MTICKLTNLLAVPFDVKLSDTPKTMLEIQRMARQLLVDDLTDKDTLKT